LTLRLLALSTEEFSGAARDESYKPQVVQGAVSHSRALAQARNVLLDHTWRANSKEEASVKQQVI